LGQQYVERNLLTLTIGPQDGVGGARPTTVGSACEMMAIRNPPNPTRPSGQSGSAPSEGLVPGCSPTSAPGAHLPKNRTHRSACPGCDSGVEETADCRSCRTGRQPKAGRSERAETCRPSSPAQPSVERHLLAARRR